MQDINSIQLTDDASRNILIMAPMLDETGRDKVFGLVCGLIPSATKSGTDIKNRKTS